MSAGNAASDDRAEIATICAGARLARSRAATPTDERRGGIDHDENEHHDGNRDERHIRRERADGRQPHPRREEASRNRRQSAPPPSASARGRASTPRHREKAHHAQARRLGNRDERQAERKREDDQREHRSVGGGAKHVCGHERDEPSDGDCTEPAVELPIAAALALQRAIAAGSGVMCASIGVATTAPTMPDAISRMKKPQYLVRRADRRPLRFPMSRYRRSGVRRRAE